MLKKIIRTKNTSISKFYIYVILVFVISLSMFSYLDATEPTQLLNSPNEISFNPYLTECFGNFTGYVEASYLVKIKQPRDIYLSESLNNFWCLGKVVDIYQEDNSVTYFYGRNLKVNLLLHILLVTTFIFFIFSKYKKLFFIILFLQQFIFFYLNKYLLNFSNVFGNLFLIFTVYIIFQLIFYDSKNRNEINKIEAFFGTLDKNVASYFKLFNLKIPNIFTYLTLLITSVIFGIFKLQSRSKYEYYNDELIQIFTAAKSHYFEITSIQAALLNHTPINSQLFKVIFQFSEFKNFEFGLVILEIIFALVTTLIIFNILNTISKKTVVNFVFSFSYLVFISSNLLLNRIIAQLIYALLILILFSYMNQKNDYKLFAISFFAMLQIYNMESYVAPLFAIFIFIFIHIFSKQYIFVIKSVFYSLICIVIIYFNFFLNQELIKLFESNYLFHLLNTKRNFNTGTLINALGFSNQLSIAHVVFILLLSRVLFYLFNTIKKNKKIIYKNYELLFFYWFVGELIHLVLTGPRFPHYGLVLVLPSFFIIYIYSVHYLDSRKFIAYAISILLLFGYFSNSFKVMSFYASDEIRFTSQDFLDTDDKKKINMILSNELIEEKPSLALTWIDAYDWRFFHLDLNTLPSTKYWWWFYMKYFQEDKYKWESNWNEEKIAKDFQDDFLIEKPEWAIVDRNLPKYPKFFENVLLEYYEIEFEGSQFSLYKIKDS